MRYLAMHETGKKRATTEHVHGDCPYVLFQTSEIAMFSGNLVSGRCYGPSGVAQGGLKIRGKCGAAVNRPVHGTLIQGKDRRLERRVAQLCGHSSLRPSRLSYFIGRGFQASGHFLGRT